MNEANRPIAQFQSTIEMINSFPKWVQEAIFVYLKTTLSKNYMFNKIEAQKEKDFLFLYIPKLTDNGKSFIANNKYHKEEEDHVYLNFLNNVKKQKYLVDIASDNNWNLALTCKYLSKVWQNHLIEEPSSKELFALVKLLANEIKIDEYFLQTKKINHEQFTCLNKILNSNMMSSIEDKKEGHIEDVFANLGYLPPDEIDYVKSLIQLSKSNLNVENTYFVLLEKFQELKQSYEKSNKERNYLVDDKQYLENNINKLNKMLEESKKEKEQYQKEVEQLKIELKKALKG